MKLFSLFKIWLPEKHRQSLDASWKEGIPGNMMIAITDFFLVPYALFLGAPHAAIGMLVGWPGLLGSIFQLAATQMVQREGSRLQFLINMTRVQGLLLIAAALLCFWQGPWSVIVLTVLTILFRIVGNWVATAWGSLMSDYLEPHERGRYMGSRQFIVGLAGIVALVFASGLLDGLKPYSEALGFGLLFVFTGGLRLYSSHLFKRMQDLPYEEKPESKFTFWMFIRRFRQSNFVKFVVFTAGITFATQLSAPYFSVYMLDDLHYNYFQFMAVHLMALVSALIAAPLWGRIADRTGNVRVLKITGALIPFVPILWVFSTNWYYLLAVEIYAGFVWGGFNLCAANFIFDSVSQEKRVRCLSYFNLINGAALFLGATLGGVLIEMLPKLNGYAAMSLFLISGLLRLFLYLLPIHRFREVREKVQPMSSRELFFSVLGIRSLAGRDPD